MAKDKFISVTKHHNLNADIGLGSYAPLIKFSTLEWFIRPYLHSGWNFIWEEPSACIKWWAGCTSERVLYSGKWTNPCTCQTSNPGQLHSWLRNVTKLIPLLWARQSKAVADRGCNYVAPGRGRRSVHRRRLIILSTDENSTDFGNDGTGEKSGLRMLMEISVILGPKGRWVELEMFIPVAFYMFQTVHEFDYMLLVHWMANSEKGKMHLFWWELYIFSARLVWKCRTFPMLSMLNIFPSAKDSKWTLSVIEMMIDRRKS